MKNLILLSAAGMGDRSAMGAPTFWTTMNGYARAGWRVWIFNASVKDGVTGRTDFPDGVHLIQQEPPWRRQVRIRKLGYFYFLAQCAWIRRWQREQAEKLIAAEGLDKTNTVVYGDEVLSVPAARDIQKAFGMKLVTRFCGTVMFDKPYNLENKLRWYPHYQSLAVPSDLVIMTNDGTRGKEVLERIGNRSPQVFWFNGVDLPEEEPAEQVELPFAPGDKVLMTLSRLNAWKHVDRAIAALPAVLEKHPEVRLLVCGYGPEQEALVRQAEELGVRERVTFTGQIPHSTAFSYLRKADIFLSLYDLSNLGNPLFEAMRCSLPIVTLDVGATNTVITGEENGILLPMEDLEHSIPAAINRLLEDPELARRLGEAAGAFAMKNLWTWEERVRAETDAVEALLTPDER